VAARAIRYIIDELRPPGDPSGLGVFPELKADALLMALGDEHPNGASARVIKALRDQFGARAAERLVERRKQGGGLPKIAAQEQEKADIERTRPIVDKGGC
jgi:hypothetical protein